MGIVGDWHQLYTSHGVRESNAKFLTFIALFGGLGTCTVSLMFGVWLLWSGEDPSRQVIGAVFSAVSIATGVVLLFGPKVEGRAWWAVVAGWLGFVPGAVVAPFSPMAAIILIGANCVVYSVLVVTASRRISE